MPFADHRGAISGSSQRFGDGDAPARKLTAVRRLAKVLAHRADADLMRILPRQQRSPRRAAARVVVELAEAHAALRERINVRRVNLTAVASEIGEAHVVGDDEDDVRTSG